MIGGTPCIRRADERNGANGRMLRIGWYIPKKNGVKKIPTAVSVHLLNHAEAVFGLKGPAFSPSLTLFPPLLVRRNK